MAASIPTFKPLSHALALDGLRAIAITSVVLFHFPTRRVVVGGLFGVDLFFALSGFLITGLLLAEFGRYGTIDLPAFLGRRAWRLLPALAVFLLLYLVGAAAFGHTTWFASNPFGRRVGRPVSMVSAVKSVVAIATYSMNAMKAANIPLPNITHLWSLSVEGQFYVLWPVVMVGVLRRKIGLLLPLTIALACLSAVTPWLVWHGGAGKNMIYFSSYTRFQGLLIGSIGAQLWSRGYIKVIPMRIRQLSAGMAFALYVWLCLRVANVELKYLGGITLASIAGIVMVVHFAEDDRTGIFRWVLSSPPLVWLGQRSYAVYLWHYLFDCWTNPLPHRLGVPLGMGLSLVAAEISWRLVERPAQRMASRRRQRRREAQLPAPVACYSG